MKKINEKLSEIFDVDPIDLTAKEPLSVSA
jgi:hypothetical protein